MESGLAESLGINPSFFHWVLVPAMIFLARIVDVSINTLRVITMLNGKKWLSTTLGFFESLIWLIVISQILQNVSSWASYLAYAGGFAGGIFVGMKIENALAMGTVILRVITQKSADDLVDFLRSKKLKVTTIEAESNDGGVKVVFLIVKRKNLSSIINKVLEFNPKAFYSVENVKYVNQLDGDVTTGYKLKIPFFQSFNRK